MKTFFTVAFAAGVLCFFNAAYGAEKFDFSDLQAILKSNPEIRSIDQLLLKLPASYRKYYSVVYNSPSRQGGTPRSPRIIAFGAPLEGLQEASIEGYTSQVSTRNDYVILGFKSDPSQKVGMLPDEDDLETFEFVPSEKTWVARVITFPNRASDRAALTDVERYRISENNPMECMGCHRGLTGAGKFDPDRVRPNWEAYPRWPNTFGSNANPYDKGDEGKEAQAEREALRLFVDGGRDTEGNEVTPIQKLPRFSMLNPFPIKKEPNAIDGTSRYKAYDARNAELTAKLGHLNYRRIGRLLLQPSAYSDVYARYQYAIYAAFSGCRDFASFLTEESKARLGDGYEALAARTRAVMDAPEFGFRLFDRVIERDIGVVTSLRYVFEGEGLDIDPWFMNVKRAQFRMNAVGSPFYEQIGEILAKQIWQNKATRHLSAYPSYELLPEGAQSCAELKELSLRQQRAAADVSPAPGRIAPQAVVEIAPRLRTVVQAELEVNAPAQAAQTNSNAHATGATASADRGDSQASAPVAPAKETARWKRWLLFWR